MNPLNSNTLEEELKQAMQKLAEREKRILELEKINESLQTVNLETTLNNHNKRFLIEFSERFSSHSVQKDFFDSLVLYIAELTRLDYVFIGELQGEGIPYFDINTISFAIYRDLVENIQYPAIDCPCEQVIKGKIYSHPKECRLIFPKNKTLEKYNIEGYDLVPNLGHGKLEISGLFMSFNDLVRR